MKEIMLQWEEEGTESCGGEEDRERKDRRDWRRNSAHLFPCVRRQQVLVQLEQVVDVLVQPEEGRIARRSLEVLHDARRHLQERRMAVMAVMAVMAGERQ
jgi:hypothetical protein